MRATRPFRCRVCIEICILPCRPSLHWLKRRRPSAAVPARLLLGDLIRFLPPVTTACYDCLFGRSPLQQRTACERVFARKRGTTSVPEFQTVFCRSFHSPFPPVGKWFPLVRVCVYIRPRFLCGPLLYTSARMNRPVARFLTQGGMIASPYLSGSLDQGELRELQRTNIPSMRLCADRNTTGGTKPSCQVFLQV